MLNVLFLCSRNRLRSPTAAQVFAAWDGIETDSAGLEADADHVLESEQLDWADVIFVMESRHKKRLHKSYAAHLKAKRIVVLDILDDYAFMQPELVALLERKVGPLLKR